MTVSGWLRFALFLLICACAVPLRAATPPLSITDALNHYDHGDYPAFFDAITRPGAVDAKLFPVFEKDANAWLKIGDATSADRRALVAASVALEIAHLLRDRPPDQAGHYLVWASLLMRQHQPAEPLSGERWWYLASLAGMEELEDPWGLILDAPRRDLEMGVLVRALGARGHLADALKRFPDEPRLRLVGVEATEHQWGSVISGFDEVLTPAVLEDLQARAAGRIPDVPQTAYRLQSPRGSAPVELRAYAELPDIERDYQALSAEDTPRAEIELHVGYLEFRLDHLMNALDHLQRVPALADEPYLRYLSEYFAGRVYQESGDHALAIAAFERAATIVPHARSAATELAKELFLSDSAASRDRVYPLLQSAYVDAAPEDPWSLYFHGDARLWPMYMAHLHEALK